MPGLRIKTGPEKDRFLVLGDRNVILGREGDLPIHDSAASRRHAEVFKVGEMYFIRDLGSTNGTYVNDTRIDEEELLREGDRIRIGSTVLIFEQTVQPEEGEVFEDESVMHTIEIRLDRSKLAELAEEERPTQSLITLYDVARVIASETSEESLLSKILELTATATNGDSGYIFLKDEESGKLVPKAHFTPPSGQVPKVSSTIIRRVVQQARAVLTSDAGLDSRFKTSTSVVLKKIKSVLCAPLVSMDRIVGVIYLHSEKAGTAFTDDDLELVTAIGFQTGTAIENLRIHERDRQILLGAVRTLASAIEYKDPTMKGHCDRCCLFASAVAAHLHLQKDQRERLEIAAMLHDVGMIAISDAGLHHVGKEVVHTGGAQYEHAVLGGELVGRMTGMSDIASAVRHHHERYDGSGGPDGLKGNQIPLFARILAVAEAYDTLLTGGGIQEKALSPKEALIELGKERGKKYDPDALKALLLAHRNGRLIVPRTTFEISGDVLKDVMGM